MTILEVTEILEEMKGIPGFEPGYANVASIETIKNAYNGCGPERWPSDIRERLDEKTRLYAPSILVHDLDFEESDGTDEKLHEANERFHRNNRRIFDFHYPLWSLMMFRPSYRIERAKAFAAMAALNLATKDIFTRNAWNAAYKRRGESSEQSC